MLERILKPMILALGAGTAIKLSAFLTSKGIADPFALLLAVAGAVVLTTLLDFCLLELPMRFRKLRKYFDPLYSIEGYWYESVTSPDHPHSYVCIEYDYRAKRFQYQGQNFTPVFELNASFSSETLEVRRDAKEIWFQFTAHVHRPTRSAVRGYATIRFYTDGKRHFTRGDGSFVESEGPPAVSDGPASSKTGALPMKELGLVLDRIPDSFVTRALDRASIATNAEIPRLIMAYVKSRKGAA